MPEKNPKSPKENRKTLTLTLPTMSIKQIPEKKDEEETVPQNLHGRSKNVPVEYKRRRTLPSKTETLSKSQSSTSTEPIAHIPIKTTPPQTRTSQKRNKQRRSTKNIGNETQLTAQEQEFRRRAVQASRDSQNKKQATTQLMAETSSERPEVSEKSNIEAPHILSLQSQDAVAVVESQDAVTESQDAVAESQDAVAESQDAIAESQDAISESQDAGAVPQPQDTVSDPQLQGVVVPQPQDSLERLAPETEIGKPTKPKERERKESPPKRGTKTKSNKKKGEQNQEISTPIFPNLDEEERKGEKNGVGGKQSRGRVEGERRHTGKNIMHAWDEEEDQNQRVRPLIPNRKVREKSHKNLHTPPQIIQPVIREVILPETITVQELANRIARRAKDVIKALMNMGTMVTINQTIDADTAELVITEFGHRVRRVSEYDIEEGLEGVEDSEEDCLARPPVVTVMGHVDHGKTSLLDVLRETDTVSSEIGGITQHIGAYQITAAEKSTTSKKSTTSNVIQITFIDTPGHAAFTEMRARGANITDIVVLVIAANDGLMPQTIEAIRHAKAANVPLIIAINKIDLPDAEPQRVREALLQHEVVVEEMGGDVLNVEISAKKRTGLKALLKSILLQAEILTLKSNPHRLASGTVIEAKLERGRGSIISVLVQKGTLKPGDCLVAGCSWGKVRALMSDRGHRIEAALPSTPVEIIGINGLPLAGDKFFVVDKESKAREIALFRQRKKRDQITLSKDLQTIFDQKEITEIPVILKADTQGSLEAMSHAINNLNKKSPEVGLKMLHSAVGAITETDISFAHTASAMVLAFNVRANPQARDTAKRDAIEIRYYSIIYHFIEDIKKLLEKVLKPTLQEDFLGAAKILKVFNIHSIGQVAGCLVSNGIIRRGATLRLLRDNIVIHQGKLKTIRRFKEEVKEVREGYECGMVLENCDNIQVDDVIEAFEIKQIPRTL